MIHVSLELSHVINEYIILEHVMSILLEGSVYYLGILHLITSHIINNFKTGGITTVSAMPRTIEMSKNMGIFVPKKMLINTCVKMPIGFTNITSSTARTHKLVNNT